MSGTTGTPGRRAAARTTGKGRDVTLITGLVAVLVSGLALAVQAPAAEQDEVPVEPPDAIALDNAWLACPAPAGPGSPAVAIGSAAEEDGEGSVTLRPAQGDAESDVDLAAGSVTSAPAPEAAVVTGSGALAPALFAARFGTAATPAAGECTAPTGVQWFLGAGAGGLHASRLQLVNPDAGPAVADVTVWSTEGAMERVDSRGLTIPGRRSTVLDLQEVAPHRNELALEVRVVRGRLSATVEDEYASETGDPARDWLPASQEPAEDLLVPGLPRAAEENTLTLVNPGDTEGRVSLQVVTPRTTFAPAGVEDIRVPAGQVVVTDLSDALEDQLGEEDAALRLRSTVPVTGALRSVVAEDLVHLPAVEVAPGATSALVPPTGTEVLVLGGADVAGPVSVTFVGEDGETGRERVRLRPDTTTAVPVPGAARAVLVDSEVGYAGSLRSVGPAGAALLPLRPLVVDQLVPQVTPAWP